MNNEEKKKIMKSILSLLDNVINNNQSVLSISINDAKKTVDDKVLLLTYIADNIEIIKEYYTTINICALNERIPHKQLEILKSFHKKTKNHIKCNILVNHINLNNSKTLRWQKLWDIETIIKANNCINKVCKAIKDANLSPAEALAYVHNFVSTIVEYNASTVRNYDSNDQFFTGAFLKKPEFVCAGYTSLEKEIIDNLGIKGLSCEIICMDAYNLDTDINELHRRVVVSLQDKKYGINETVFDDPTWDNTNDKNIPLYSNFLMPINCHEDNMSKFDYKQFSLIEKRKHNEDGYIDRYTDYNLDFYENNNKVIEQNIIEKIQFNMLTKAYPHKSFEEVFTQMSEMAKLSYKKQQDFKYKKCLKTGELTLSKEQAQEIYNENNEEYIKKEIKETDLTL